MNTETLRSLLRALIQASVILSGLGIASSGYFVFLTGLDWRLAGLFFASAALFAAAELLIPFTVSPE